MFDKLEEVVARYEELNQMLVSPEVLADSKKMIECNKAINEITEIVEKYKEYKKYVDDIEFIKESFKTEKDPDMKEMLNEELKEAEEKLPSLEEELKILLLPKDKNDDKNVIVEIRGGAGGDEAALFAADLFRMYSRYAERKKWKIE
ncbi:MAG: PCRF domain-containing protein, partial [Fusobacterium periodonticum]|nr:PCRF domain-containing protein [Fusobacterium periodonticum]